ncbi:hypothetical protein Tco_1317804 [Tanacetum coccineum]
MQMESYESFMCRCEGALKKHRCGYFKWKDEITFGNASSFSGPTTLSNSSSRASSSSGSSRAVLSPGNTECSNYKLLTMKIKILEARLDMEKNPDDHPCESAAILHELLNEMENLHMEYLENAYLLFDRLLNSDTQYVKMALSVAPSYHGGMQVMIHPNGPTGCYRTSSGQRGPTTLQALKTAYKKNNNKRLEAGFDYKDQKTFRPVGGFSSNLVSLIGNLVKNLPLDYDTWEQIPETARVSILPELKGWFNLEPHLNDQTMIRVGKKDKTVGSMRRRNEKCRRRMTGRKAKRLGEQVGTGGTDRASGKKRAMNAEE